jgi:anti-anti-sigma factor
MKDSHSGPIRIVTRQRQRSGFSTNRLNQLLSSGEKTIMLDFQEVLYLTSAAFRVLLVATDEAENKDARVVLCGLARQVRELFEMGGLLEVVGDAPEGTAVENLDVSENTRAYL